MNASRIDRPGKMRSVKTIVASVSLVCIVATGGCASTLFFPVKPAEKAADKVINEVWPYAAKPVVAAEAQKS